MFSQDFGGLNIKEIFLKSWMFIPGLFRLRCYLGNRQFGPPKFKKGCMSVSNFRLETKLREILFSYLWLHYISKQFMMTILLVWKREKPTHVES